MKFVEVVGDDGFGQVGHNLPNNGLDNRPGKLHNRFVFGALGGASGLLSGSLYDRFKNGNIIIQAALVLAVPLLFFSFRAEGLLSIALFILGGFFLISTQPVCIRMSQDLLPGNMGLASSLILGSVRE